MDLIRSLFRELPIVYAYELIFLIVLSHAKRLSWNKPNTTLSTDVMAMEQRRTKKE